MAIRKPMTKELDARNFEDDTAQRGKEVAVQSAYSASVPDYLKDYEGDTGLEHFDKGDFKIPRLKLLQALSPEVQEYPGKALPGQFWLTSSKQALGDKLEFVVCIAKRRAALWAPKGTDQGILAYSRDAVHWDKPDTEFTVELKNVGKVTWNTDKDVPSSGLLEWGSSNPKDKDSHPAATLQYEYLIYMLPDGDFSPVVFSLYRTGIDTAKDFNTMLHTLRRPMQSVRVLANSRIERRAGNTFYMWNFALGGFVSAPQFQQAKSIADRFSEFEAEENTKDEIDVSNVKDI